MLTTQGYATHGPSSQLQPFSFSRRELGPSDVLIEILFCGICHSDIHQARDEWGGAAFPMVPGHEIVGRVKNVGEKVKNFKVGDFAGVGCFVDSCRNCKSCKEGEEQYCETHLSLTYNSTEQDKKTPTYGGYSSQVVVDEKYTLRINKELPLEQVAPLLCAGITTYSPLKRWKVGSNSKVGIMGLGGLGHMGVKLAASMGAHVTVLSTSQKKERDAKQLGAHDFLVVKSEDDLQNASQRFDLILNTVSAPHNMDLYINLLKRDGVMVMLGIPTRPAEVGAFSLVGQRRILTGSLIGGIRETQEMLDYCAQKNITSTVEVIPIQKINQAYERIIQGDVHYRFVIDMKSLNQI